MTRHEFLNQDLIGKANGRTQLATPALVLDMKAFTRNVEAMQAPTVLTAERRPRTASDCQTRFLCELKVGAELTSTAQFPTVGFFGSWELGIWTARGGSDVSKEGCDAGLALRVSLVVRTPMTRINAGQDADQRERTTAVALWRRRGHMQAAWEELRPLQPTEPCPLGIVRG